MIGNKKSSKVPRFALIATIVPLSRFYNRAYSLKPYTFREHSICELILTFSADFASAENVRAGSECQNESTEMLITRALRMLHAWRVLFRLNCKTPFRHFNFGAWTSTRNGEGGAL